MLETIVLSPENGRRLGWTVAVLLRHAMRCAAKKCGPEAQAQDNQSSRPLTMI